MDNVLADYPLMYSLTMVQVKIECSDVDIDALMLLLPPVTFPIPYMVTLEYW